MKALALCTVLLSASLASAADYGTSKQFALDGSQRLAGVLVDPSGSAIPGLLLEVLNGKTVVRQFRTDNEGKFSLEELPSAKYRLRVISQPFCAPKIECRTHLCTVDGMLAINENRAKSIHVYF